MLITQTVIGHRGACAYAPENTFAAFNKALALGCRFIEFDVMLSLDNEPFVIHDEMLDRTTNGQGGVGLAPASYLNSLDAGQWFSSAFAAEKIPHFKDILLWLDKNNVYPNIEIKPYPGKSEQTAAVILNYLSSLWPAIKPYPLVSSFDLTVLDYCKNKAPHLPLGLLIDSWVDEWLEKAQSLNCYSIHANEDGLNNKQVEIVKKHDYRLYVYTVNCRRRAQELLGWGVDAVFSDYPDLLA